MTRASGAISGGAPSIRACDELQTLLQLAGRRTVTLVYSAADEEYDQAVSLKEVIAQLSC